MGNLVLLVDHAAETRRRLRRRLESSGYEPVEASTVRVALELIQRIPKSFRLVLTRLHMPDLPGVALVETLRLFHPGIPVMCIRPEPPSAVAIACPEVSDHGAELELQLRQVEGERELWAQSTSLPADAVRRARERYARTSDLVEAAEEVARGLLPD
jgi:CheY-like chemotaxis protein